MARSLAAGFLVGQIDCGYLYRRSLRAVAMVDSLSFVKLVAEFEADASLDGDFLVLTISASLIASFDLLADSAAVLIGAMVIAPWILPLR